MKKLLTTLALALALLFGGAVTLAAPAAADGACDPAVCATPQPACDPVVTACPTAPPTQPSCDPVVPGACDTTALWSKVTAAEQTANDYRAQVIALTAKAERLQRVADRRAATIQRLRAVIRSLR